MPENKTEDVTAKIEWRNDGGKGNPRIHDRLMELLAVKDAQIASLATQLQAALNIVAKLQDSNLKLIAAEKDVARAAVANEKLVEEITNLNAAKKRRSKPPPKR